MLAVLVQWVAAVSLVAVVRVYRQASAVPRLGVLVVAVVAEASQKQSTAVLTAVRVQVTEERQTEIQVRRIEVAVEAAAGMRQPTQVVLAVAVS